MVQANSLPGDESPGPRAGPTHWPGVVFGLSLSAFAAFQMFKLPPVVPLFLADYGFDRTLTGAFMSVYALMGLILSVGLGRVIERRGALGPLFAGLAAMAAGNLLVLIWPQHGWLVLAARGLEGAGFAVLAILGPTLANRLASPRHLPIVIGLTATWIPTGQLTAALIAPGLIALTGWRGLWFLGLAGCLAFAIWGWRSRRDDGLAPGPSRRDTSDPPRRAEPTRAQKLALVLAAAVFLLWSGQYFAYMTWLPQYLVEVHGFALSWALMGYSLPVAVLLVFNVVTGFLLRWRAPLGALIVGALCLQAAVWWSMPATGAGWGGILSLLAYGLGAGVTPTCLFAIPSVILGQGRGTAAAFGVLMTGRNIGVLIGPVLLAEAFRLSGSWNLASPIFGVTTTLAVMIAATLAYRVARLGRRGAGT